MAVRREKGRQVTGDRRIGCEGQAEFLESGTAATRPGVQRHQGKEAFDEQFVDFAPLDLDLPRSADQSRARPGQAERQPLRRRGTQQRLLELPAPLHEHGPLPRLQACRRAMSGDAETSELRVSVLRPRPLLPASLLPAPCPP